MKKSLLTITMLTITLALQAQDRVLTHVDDAGLVYVSANTLVYSGGGLQTKAGGIIENHGNIMIVGAADGKDVVKTIDGAGANKTSGGNIILKNNNHASPIAATTTYGQLFITGVEQGKITATVDKEYAATKNGAYQQIGIPFKDKSFTSLNSEFNAAWNTTRWQGKEILKWDNTMMRYDGSIIPTSQITTANHPGITVALADNAVKGVNYALGTGTAAFNPELVKTIKGVPYADGITGSNKWNLTPSTVTYGTGGNTLNIYRERYNTYIMDTFENSTPWINTFGKHIYQFTNPYLTNLDLSKIGYDESADYTGTNIGGSTDGNNISNIWGIVAVPTNVQYNNGTTATFAANQVVTFDPTNGKPLGNLPAALMIRPMGSFSIKLRNNTPATLDVDNLRRFSYSARAVDTSYNVTAARTSSSTATTKQLGVLALDAAGNQIAETYYVVAPHYHNGFIPNAAAVSVQAFTDVTSFIHTFEEEPNVGGADPNYASSYRLYINEANENTFAGKKIDMKVYNPQIVSLKFEIRENSNLINNGVHALSSGIGFYYTGANGQAVQIKQGDVIPVAGADYGLYYGQPVPTGSLSTNETKDSSRTLIVYNPAVENYIVRFDPEWKSADIKVYDMSGKLVISEKGVKTTSDYVINLDSKLKNAYVVQVTGNDGSIVNGKIITK